MTWGADASPYEILEISPNASREEIEASYRRIIGFLEPDNLVTYAMLDEGEVAQVRSQVDQAYQMLCQAERRASAELGYCSGGVARVGGERSGRLAAGQPVQHP